MPDEDRDALRTPLGREKMLEDHEGRIDDLEKWQGEQSGKEARRDKRWDLAVRSIVAIAVGIIIAVVSALVAGGAVHP